MGIKNRTIPYAGVVNWAYIYCKLDAWEANQTSYQPPDTVLKAIEIEKGMVIGEIGAGRGSSHANPKEDLISQVKEAGYSFDQVAVEMQRDDIYIFKKL